jgi:hypothetical protein
MISTLSGTSQSHTSHPAKRVAQMHLDPFTGLKTQLANRVRGVFAARRRRIEHERAFYRQLMAYCDENNLAQICADDWKTAAYARVSDKHSPRYTKGHVS